MAKEFTPGETLPSGDGGGSGGRKEGSSGKMEFRAGETEPGMGRFKDLDDWGAHGEPEKLREWVLEEQLGAGGWGVVYRARHEHLGHERAVKVLKPAVAALGDNVDAFMREGKTLMKFSGHPGIVQVQDLARDDAFAWMVMELVEGIEVDGHRVCSLAQMLALADQVEGARVPEDLIFQWGVDVLTALEVAHDRGMVHRDIKPGNILLESDGRAKLADFGLVKLLTKELDAVRGGTRSVDKTTETGKAIKGTLSYMSPEQEDGKAVDGRSDLYSLSIVLYQLLTGRLPRGRFKLPGELGLNVAEWWDSLLDRGLQEEVDDRWQDAGEMRNELRRRKQAPEEERSEPSPQEMWVTSEPAGAEVWHGTKKVGVTPWMIPEVNPGMELSYLIKKLGYEDQEVSETVGSGTELLLNAVLRETPKAMVIAAGDLGEEQDYEIADGVKMRFCWVPAGRFGMGSPEEEGGRFYSEGPVRGVTISQGFWMGKYEVTQGEWEAVMGSDPSKFTGGKRLPVERVSWNDICGDEKRGGGFLGKVGIRAPEGWRFDLPSEAQWEYACRAGTTGAYAGDLDGMGWYSSNAGSKTHEVGGKRANKWGLCDMHGNVYEWCRDWYADSYPGLKTVDPEGPAGGTYRVNRGGCWITSAGYCRSANRDWYSPDYRNDYVGFRLSLQSVSPAAR